MTSLMLDPTVIPMRSLFLLEARHGRVRAPTRA